jgi:GAF domain-containing protein
MTLGSAARGCPLSLLGDVGQESGSTGSERTLERGAAAEPADVLTVAERLAGVSQSLVGAADVRSTLTTACRLVVEQVPGCLEASVVLVGRGSRTSVGATSPVAEALDELQSRMAQGPSLDALAGEEVVRVDDLLHDRRWPSLGPAAARTWGIRSVLACRLHAGDRTLGALNLYSTEPHAFDGVSRTADLGTILASHVAVALASAQALEGLHAALESRETISVAMGMLMARQNITRAEALDVLRRASQRENVKLREIAARIIGDAGDVLGPGG